MGELEAGERRRRGEDEKNERERERCRKRGETLLTPLLTMEKIFVTRRCEEREKKWKKEREKKEEEEGGEEIDNRERGKHARDRIVSIARKK